MMGAGPDRDPGRPVTESRASGLIIRQTRANSELTDQIAQHILEAGVKSDVTRTVPFSFDPLRHSQIASGELTQIMDRRFGRVQLIIGSGSTTFEEIQAAKNPNDCLGIFVPSLGFGSAGFSSREAVATHKLQSYRLSIDQPPLDPNQTPSWIDLVSLGVMPENLAFQLQIHQNYGALLRRVASELHLASE